MKQYIDKDAVIAKIEELDEFYHFYKSASGLGFVESLLSFINTLEVKEVNLENELNKLDSTLYDMDGIAIEDNSDSSETRYITVEDVKDIAKHFFELGLLQKLPIDSSISRTLIVYENKLYEADWIPRGCKDKCKNCPINSQCASEDMSLCEQYGLNPNDMHISKKLT